MQCTPLCIGMIIYKKNTYWTKWLIFFCFDLGYVTFYQQYNSKLATRKPVQLEVICAIFSHLVGGHRIAGYWRYWAASVYQERRLNNMRWERTGTLVTRRNETKWDLQWNLDVGASSFARLGKSNPLFFNNQFCSRVIDWLELLTQAKMYHQ